MSQPPQYSQGSADMALKVRDVLSQNYNVYEVARLAPTNLYHAECGSLAMNILCGCFAQYYAYDVEILPQGVNVRSTVPCNGWWGGAIGAGKNADETCRVQHALQQAFQAGIIGYETAAPSSPATVYMSRPPAQAVTSSTSGPSGALPPPLTTPSAAGSTTITKTTHADGSLTVTKETIHPNGTKSVEITTTKRASAEGEGKVPSTHSNSMPMKATIYQPGPEVTSYYRSAPVVIRKETEQLPGPARQIATSSPTTCGPAVRAPPPPATTRSSGSSTITKMTHTDGSLTITKETFHPDGTKTVETTTTRRASAEGEEVLASHNNSMPTQPEVTAYRTNAPVVMQKETEQLPYSAQHFVVSSSSTTPPLPTPSAAGSTTITKTTHADGSLTVTKETFHPNGTKTVEITTTKLASSGEKEKLPSTHHNRQIAEASPPQSEPEVTTDDRNTSDARQEGEPDQQSDPGDPTDGAASPTTSTAGSTSVTKTHADDSPADTEEETFDANEAETIEITTKKRASGDEEVQVVPVIHSMPMTAEPELSTAEYWTAQPVAMRQEVQPQLKTVLPPSGGTTTTTTTTTEIASSGLVTVRKESLNQNGSRVIRTTTYANVNAAMAAGVVL